MAGLSDRSEDTLARSIVAPVFAGATVKIPRFLFPFDVDLYHWTV